MLTQIVRHLTICDRVCSVFRQESPRCDESLTMNHQMSNENPYQQSPFRSPRYAQQTSSLAVVALVSGLISIPLICMCFLSLPFSIAAIVLGHVSRGVVRQSEGDFEGYGMATAGMLLGYISLAMVLAVLAYPFAASNNGKRAAAPAAASVQSALLQQAEGQLLAESGPDATGVTTTDRSAIRLAKHYLEALQILDETHFAEQDDDDAGHAQPRRYRVFVQLNAADVAFLLYVPEMYRFTEDATQLLQENAWLIAQRSVDDHLPNDSRLAVAIYSDQGRQTVMTGRTTANVSSEPDDVKGDVDDDHRRLEAFFRVAEPSAEFQDNPAEDSTADLIPIDRKPDIVLPAEAERE